MSRFFVLVVLSQVSLILVLGFVAVFLPSFCRLFAVIRGMRLGSDNNYGLGDSNPSKTARPIGHLTPLPMARKHCFYGILSLTLLPSRKACRYGVQFFKPTAFKERKTKTWLSQYCVLPLFADNPFYASIKNFFVKNLVHSIFLL